MSQYIGTFGVTRRVGEGEGRDILNNACAKPAEGGRNFIEVVVDANGPVANAGTKFGLETAYLPKGAHVVDARLVTEVKGSGANITIDLVDADGTNAVALFGATTPSANKTVDVVSAQSEALNVILSANKYVKAGGTRTGYTGKLIVEFI